MLRAAQELLGRVLAAPHPSVIHPACFRGHVPGPVAAVGPAWAVSTASTQGWRGSKTQSRSVHRVWKALLTLNQGPQPCQSSSQGSDSLLDSRPWAEEDRHRVPPSVQARPGRFAQEHFPLQVMSVHLRGHNRTFRESGRRAMCCVMLLDSLTLGLCPHTLSGGGLNIIFTANEESHINTSYSSSLHAIECFPDCSF